MSLFHSVALRCWQLLNRSIGRRLVISLELCVAASRGSGGGGRGAESAVRPDGRGLRWADAESGRSVDDAREVGRREERESRGLEGL